MDNFIPVLVKAFLPHPPFSFCERKGGSICPNRKTICPNGRISSQGIDGGRFSGYDGITVKCLLNRYNEYAVFREEFST